MEVLNHNELFLLSTHLNLTDLLNFCLTSKRIFFSIWENKDIWLYQLKSFPDYKKLDIQFPKKSYVLLYNLTKLKDKLKLNESVYEIRRVKILHLEKRQICDLPNEIGILTNLQILYLDYNQINFFPNKILNMINLRELYLNNNHILSLPKEIGNLIDLQILNLNDNYISFLPKEIGNLSDLKELYLNCNKINTLPEEIEDLRKLSILQLNNNLLTVLPKRFPFNLKNLNISHNKISKKDIKYLNKSLPKTKIIWNN
jgi:Leucine-rich repeat (LRR) protein